MLYRLALGMKAFFERTRMRSFWPVFAVHVLLTHAGLLAAAAPAAVAPTRSVDCTRATVVLAASADPHQQQAVRMLLEEAGQRSHLQWAQTNNWPKQGQRTGCVVLVGSGDQLRSLLPIEIVQKISAPESKPEAFRLQSLSGNASPTLIASGSDDRGVLFAVGALLRSFNFEAGRATLPWPLAVSEAPEKPIRSHQLGYRFKNNTYDAWTLAQFEEQIRELAIFGANTVQVIAPESDDAATSPLFPQSPMEALLGIAKIAERYGLNFDLYYPEMEADYSRPADAERELLRFDALIRQIPNLHALWVPGGDPGHTPPEQLFLLLQREAAVLHKVHPQVPIYVSAQGMDAAHFEDFYRLVNTHPAWLSGVFFGPQSRDGLEVERKRIAADVPLLFYPDIGHTMHAQFPVPAWDPAFALTEGREPIDPRPVDEEHIYRHYASLHTGFVTYSEGVNDDVNKMLWSRWGWNSGLSAQSILADYGRYFIGAKNGDQFASALLGLEQNWRGPLAANQQIEKTLATLQPLANDKQTANNWRYQMALYRAVYDAYLQRRLHVEQKQQHLALNALRALVAEESGSAAEQKSAGNSNTTAALAKSESALNAKAEDATVDVLRKQLFELGGALFHSVGLQLSVKMYGASNWERGANLDRAEIPLNDRLYLLSQIAKIRTMAFEQQAKAIRALLANYDAPRGGYYDDLGNPQLEPHRVQGSGFAVDPEFYLTVIDGVADHTPSAELRWADLTYAEALYEAPLTLHYDHLQPRMHYRLRIVYGGEDYALPLTLTANESLVLQLQWQRKTNPQTVELDVPGSATAGGQLTLSWQRPQGFGGSGRGRQVAEVWLLPEDESTAAAHPLQ